MSRLSIDLKSGAVGMRAARVECLLVALTLQLMRATVSKPTAHSGTHGSVGFLHLNTL